MPDPSPIPLPRVVALVGSDGAGKSTVAAELVAHLGRDRPTALLYLGQGSGSILSRIRRLPGIGEPIGRLLKRRSARAHPDGNRPAAPDVVTAAVIFLLSRRRLRAFRRMLALQRRGVTVVVDRYPQAEVAGFYFDGPGLSLDAAPGGVVGWLARREHLLYRRMAAPRPALVIRLNVDAATAQRRKPDHKPAMLADKARVIPTLRFGEAPVVDVDANRPLAQVIGQVLAATQGTLGPATAL